MTTDYIKAFSASNDLPMDNSSLVVCFGEMLIDFVPTTSGLSLSEAPAFKKAPGGAPANVAVGIARLGGQSAFIGKVDLELSFFFNIITLGMINSMLNIKIDFVPIYQVKVLRVVRKQLVSYLSPLAYFR